METTKRNIKQETKEKVIEKYGDYIHFKLDVGTIYVVYEDEIPVIFTDKDVANRFINESIEDCLKEWQDYPCPEELYELETIIIKDIVPATNPVKKFYHYRNVKGYDWFSENYEGCRYLEKYEDYSYFCDVVSEGTAWYDVVTECYDLDEDIDDDLIRNNIDNLNVWFDAYKKIIKQEPDSTYHFRQSIYIKRPRFEITNIDPDFGSATLYENQYYKREVAIDEDGKPFVKS